MNAFEKIAAKRKLTVKLAMAMRALVDSMGPTHTIRGLIGSTNPRAFGKASAGRNLTPRQKRLHREFQDKMFLFSKAQGNRPFRQADGVPGNPIDMQNVLDWMEGKTLGEVTGKVPGMPRVDGIFDMTPAQLRSLRGKK